LASLIQVSVITLPFAVALLLFWSYKYVDYAFLPITLVFSFVFGSVSGLSVAVVFLASFLVVAAALLFKDYVSKTPGLKIGLWVVACLVWELLIVALTNSNLNYG
jgi:hypothetical protein